MASPDVSFLQMGPSVDEATPLCEGLLRARLRELRESAAELRGMRLEEVAESLEAVARLWLVPGSHWMRRAGVEVSTESGLSAGVVEEHLRDFLSRITSGALSSLVRAELGSEEPFRVRAHPRLAASRAWCPPALTAHVLSSTVPSLGMEVIVQSLLCRSPALVRTSTNGRCATRFFLLSLREAAPRLARHVSVVTWDRESPFLAVTAEFAPVLSLWGSDGSMESMVRQLPATTRVLRYGGRVSFSVIAARAETPEILDRLVGGVAEDVALLDQTGCMSPHTVFVLGARWSVDEVAEALRVASTEVASRLPMGELGEGEGAERAQALGVAEFKYRVLRGPITSVIHGETGFHVSPGRRVVHLVPCSDFDTLIASLQSLKYRIHSIGLYCERVDQSAFLRRFSELGVSRVCRIGRMQRPLWLRSHDGRPRLADVVNWMDVEPPDETTS